LLRDRFEPPLKYATQILQIPNTDECDPSCEILDAEGTYNQIVLTMAEEQALYDAAVVAHGEQTNWFQSVSLT